MAVQPKYINIGQGDPLGSPGCLHVAELDCCSFACWMFLTRDPTFPFCDEFVWSLLHVYLLGLLCVFCLFSFGVFFRWKEMNKPKNSSKENGLVDFNFLVVRWGHFISEFRTCYSWVLSRSICGCHVSFMNHIVILSSAPRSNLGGSGLKLSRNAASPFSLPLVLWQGTEDSALCSVHIKGWEEGQEGL